MLFRDNSSKLAGGHSNGQVLYSETSESPSSRDHNEIFQKIYIFLNTGFPKTSPIVLFSASGLKGAGPLPDSDTREPPLQPDRGLAGSVKAHLCLPCPSGRMGAGKMYFPADRIYTTLPRRQGGPQSLGVFNCRLFPLCSP